jgi:hypothetical protein
MRGSLRPSPRTPGYAAPPSRARASAEPTAALKASMAGRIRLCRSAIAHDSISRTAAHAQRVHGRTDTKSRPIRGLANSAVKRFADARSIQLCASKRPVRITIVQSSTVQRDARTPVSVFTKQPRTAQSALAPRKRWDRSTSRRTGRSSRCRLKAEARLCCHRMPKNRMALRR